MQHTFYFIGHWSVKLYFEGRYVNVVTDDYFPTIDGKLIYSTCEDPTQFWMPMIEKACAK